MKRKVLEAVDCVACEDAPGREGAPVAVLDVSEALLVSRAHEVGYRAGYDSRKFDEAVEICGRYDKYTSLPHSHAAGCRNAPGAEEE